MLSYKTVNGYYTVYVLFPQMKSQTRGQLNGLRDRAVMDNSDVPIPIEILNLERKCNIFSCQF